MIEDGNGRCVERLREICGRFAIDDLAACRIDSVPHEETVSRLRAILPEVSTVLVVVKRIPDGRIACAHGALYQEAAMRVFEDLCRACEEMAQSLNDLGLTAKWPGKERTPYQKDLAALAGLGSIGDAQLLISSRYGVDVHLESLLVVEELEIPQHRDIRFECDACGLCVAACPAGAIHAGRVDREQCSVYRRTKVEPYQGKTYCGLCMKACPQRWLSTDVSGQA